MLELDGDYAVSRLAPTCAIPSWAEGRGFVSISRSDDELSIVSRADRVAQNVKSDPGWKCMKLLGPFAFDETGIILSVIEPLSNAGIGVFVVSTFDGDHLLVKNERIANARALLVKAGHRLATE